jgi:hypothetical protein
MTSDGFSVNTTLSQAANVARTQAKGQAVHADPVTTNKQLNDEKRVDRVKETEETRDKSVDPDQKRKRGPEDDHDHEERLEMEQAAEEETGDGETETPDGKGVLIDTKA